MSTTRLHGVAAQAIAFAVLLAAVLLPIGGFYLFEPPIPGPATRMFVAGSGVVWLVVVSARLGMFYLVVVERRQAGAGVCLRRAWCSSAAEFRRSAPASRPPSEASSGE